MGVFTCFSSPAKADSEARRKRGSRRFFVPESSRLGSATPRTSAENGCSPVKRLLIHRASPFLRGNTHIRVLAALNASELCENSPPFHEKGVGNAGCRHPQPRMQSKKA